MTLNEVLELLKAWGIPGLMTIVLGWVGKRYLDKKLEAEKSEHQRRIAALESDLSQYLEVHKQKIRNSEHFFKMQFEASQRLYQIKSDMMPPFRHPEMDWHEALVEMANNLAGTHKSLREFLKQYFTVLSPDILEKIEAAAGNAEEGALYGGGDDDGEPGNQLAQSVYDRINECSALLKAEVDGQRLVKFHDISKKNS